jgi:hypothetical protein
MVQLHNFGLSIPESEMNVYNFRYRLARYTHTSTAVNYSLPFPPPLSKRSTINLLKTPSPIESQLPFKNE